MERLSSAEPAADGAVSGASESGGFVEFILRERVFLGVLGLLLVIAYVAHPYPHVAMWVGFLVAAYAAVGNDSIQTLGTFIASNESQKWWQPWLYIGGIFLLTVAYSWWAFDGDVSYGRLTAKGFATAPSSFTFLQVSAPIILLVLTRLRMPVSTTFLLLTSFATSVSGVGKVLVKSISGYFIAFALAVVIWFVFSNAFDKWFAKKEAHWAWRPAQWITSGSLWSVWIMQDAANIAVYLPRSLNLLQFAGFAGIVFAGLGLLFYTRGEKVQEIVNEKSDVVDVRPATMIDLAYAIILVYHLFDSKVPMSTTWVFIGLLGGRELAMAIRKSGDHSWGEALRMMGKDALFAGIGLLVSMVLAAAVNPLFRAQLLGFAGG